MAQKKAFVRYAANKAVPGSLIVRTKAPKVGTWKEVPYDVCCGGGGQTLCFTSSTESLSDFWVIYGKRTETIVPPYLSEFSTYVFTNDSLTVATTLDEWVEIANQIYSWMGVSFSINSEDPSKVDICMKESLLKSIFPAEDGSTFNFYIGAA
jgi:hypothetical protein